MPELKEPTLNYWYRALHSPSGIEVVASDFDAARQKLYRARADAQDADLNQIALCVSPFDPNKLWLVKRKPKDAET